MVPGPCGDCRSGHRRIARDSMDPLANNRQSRGHPFGDPGVRLDREGRTGRERRFTDNPAAYEAYLRGRAAMVYGSENGTKAAIAAFEDALRLDPGYALAHAGLSMASAQMHLRFASAAEAPAWRERALSEAARAQALNADLAETHVMLADVYGTTEFEWDRVITESRRALELNPRLALPHAYTARAFYHLGLLARADEKARLALALAPESPSDALRTSALPGTPATRSWRRSATTRRSEIGSRRSSSTCVKRTASTHATDGRGCTMPCSGCPPWSVDRRHT